MKRNKIKSVFIVLHGERCEGGVVVSIHHSKIDAIKAALAINCCFEGGWTPEEDEKDYWVNGCDFVCVEKHKVKRKEKANVIRTKA